ncbi:helix-turn-helix transcriptional regulator [Salibacterium halotolerans]|uniref:Predicted DNA-binding transcriptional regulator YafY, contains an HTH and WYL domains n=1 Tax=Salibacterium halotolerans TaxID=1884432 RepID=A0A1I5XIV7_9BACI|nr:YafY family protein [Salibacterium halotolerans]SFQ31880.1 Predicted DNA-binding transcriptional regulator YafY, contains an HTH and WYL domains [Salibacterium halotolerans]
MKKPERINQMLRFINQKQHFTLQDLMHEFQISKRTALRDIAALEEVGAPIYAEYGRYGGYRLLNQIQVPPISFNSQEVFALYFAMQALQSFSNLPFQVSFRSIHEKFLNELSDNQRQEIERMQNRVAFRHTEQIADSAHLEPLLTASVKNKVLKVDYQKTSQTSTRTIQPISIYSMKGYWYCQAYDICKKAYRVFRCDRITSAEITEIQPLAGLNEMTMKSAHSLWKPSENAVQFKCLVDRKGAELFLQEHYPSMKLVHEKENMYIVGTYEPKELDFIIKYLAGFGKSMKIIEPVILKEKLRKYYKDLLNGI